MDIAFTLDVILIALLVATVVFAMILYRRLGALRTERDDLEKFLDRMTRATAKADASLKGIRQAAESGQRMLNEPLSKAQAMRDELLFLIERADSSAERLAQSAQKPAAEPAPAEKHRPAARPRPRATPAAEETSGEGQTGSQSRAERDLMNALRNVR